MQQEHLSDMVRESEIKEPALSESDLDLPEKIEEAKSQAEIPEQEGTPNIEIVSLSEWFDGNVENFPNLRKPTVSIQGIDPEEQLIIIILSRDESNQEKRKIHVFDDANTIPVLNLPAMDMQVYNNGFRIIYDLGDGIYIKSYGVRKGLISVFCFDVNNLYIPYAVCRSKKHDTNIEIITGNPDRIVTKLGLPIDNEALQLRYKQSVKADSLLTNLDGIKWLIERQGSIEDINHHLQIDNVIIDTLA
jgi:hypothetical protein